MSDTSPETNPLDRYSRQMRFPGMGKAGQQKLLASRVTLCGCGALGTVLANVLVRAGVGFIRVVDRDFVEPSNLQRQVLFDESDVANNLQKAEAAAIKAKPTTERPRNASRPLRPWKPNIRRNQLSLSPCSAPPALGAPWASSAGASARGGSSARTLPAASI